MGRLGRLFCSPDKNHGKHGGGGGLWSKQGVRDIFGEDAEAEADSPSHPGLGGASWLLNAVQAVRACS